MFSSPNGLREDDHRVQSIQVTWMNHLFSKIKKSNTKNSISCIASSPSSLQVVQLSDGPNGHRENKDRSRSFQVTSDETLCKVVYQPLVKSCQEVIRT